MNTKVFYLLVLSGWVACQSKGPDTNTSTMIRPAIERSSLQKDFKIFTSPSAEKITIVFHSPITGRALLSIYFSDGRFFEQRQLNVNKGLNTWDCYYEVKSTGIYIVKFSVDTIERSVRVFKAVP